MNRSRRHERTLAGDCLVVIPDLGAQACFVHTVAMIRIGTNADLPAAADVYRRASNLENSSEAGFRLTITGTIRTIHYSTSRAAKAAGQFRGASDRLNIFT